jgi:hypothetical protein
MPANTYRTYDVVGNREDLSNRIFDASPTDTPFVSSIRKAKAKNTLHEWQRDKLRAPQVGNAAVEGADATYDAQTPTDRLNNVTQIVRDTLSISDTQEAVTHAGGKELSRLKAKKMIELKKDVEAAAIANKTAVLGSGVLGRQMRGLAGWIQANNSLGVGGAAPNSSTNTAPTAGTARAFAETDFKTAIRLAYENGGNVTMALMRPTVKQLASAFTGNVQRTNEVTKNPKTTTLNTAFTFYGSDFGTIRMVPNRVMTAAGVDNNVYGIDTEYWALATLRSWKATELAKTGSARNFMIEWEGTLESREERASFAVRDLS